MRRLAILAALVLAGCATQPTLDERVARAPNINLCEAVYYSPPDVAQAAGAEAARRGLDCQTMLPAIASQRASQDAAAAQILMQRQRTQRQAPAQAYQMPGRTNCVSQVIANQIHTSCD